MRDQDKSKEELIEELAHLRRQLASVNAAEANENRYRDLFENVPISLWEEDFSRFKHYIDQLSQAGVSNFEQYFDENPQTVVHCASLIKINRVNRATLELFGAGSQIELLQNLTDVFTPDSYADFKRELVALAQGQTNFEVDGANRTLHGRLLHVKMRLSVAPGFENTLGRVLVSITDITARKQTEEKLRQYAARLETLHSIDRDILAARLPQEIGRVALGHIRRMIPCIRASITEFDLQKQQARILAVHQNGSTNLPAHQELPLSLFRVPYLSQGKIFRVDNLVDMPEPSALEKKLLSEGVHAFIKVPLVIENDLVGSLNVGMAAPHSFTADHLEITQEVANSLAIAIRHAQLYQQARQDAATKATLLREVNHRVKNNLSAIIGLLYVELNHTGMEKQPAYRAVMTDLINRIEGLSTIHQLLSESMWTPLPLQDIATQIIRSVLRALPPDRQVQLKISSTAPVLVVPTQANSLAMLINEMVTNTIKYAVAVQPLVLISADIARLDDNSVRLIYRDNGPGFPPAVLERQLFNVGLYLIHNIVRSDLRGTVALANDGGAVITVDFQPRPSGETIEP
jgi:PAS domain S-box-containing protein